jgi:cytochrome P450
LCSDPDIVTEIFTKNKLFQTRGLNGMKFFIPLSLLGFAESDEQWKAHRNILVGAFTESYLRKYSEEIVSCGERLSAGLKENGTVDSINRLMTDVTYEVCSANRTSCRLISLVCADS